MPDKVKCFAAVLALSVTGLMAGCHDSRMGTDHFEDNGVKGSVAVVPNDSVILDLPVIQVNHGTIFISGQVHRKPGVSGELPGRVDIEFLDADGEYLDGLPALLTPRAVPRDPNTVATYTTSYGYVPPSGATVRVHFIDKQTMIEEDLAGDDFSYGGSAGHAGHNSHASTPNHYSGTTNGMRW